MHRAWCAAAAAALTALAPPARAGLGMSTRFGLVTLENLLPGTTVNTREAANLPYVITNRSDVPLTVKIVVERPGKDLGMEKLGYEVIPDTSWVRLDRTELEAAPGQDVGADVVLHVPDDDRWLGKRYQVNLHATGQGPGMFGVGLMSVLRFSVASRRPTADELAQRSRVEKLGRVDFDLTPTDLTLEDVPLGRPVDVAKEYGRTLKVSNPNDEPLLFELKAATAREEEMGVVQGYENPPEAGFLKLESGTLKLAPDSIRKVGFVLDIPDEPRWRGRSWQFLAVGEAAGAPVALRRVTRILVRTRK